MENAEFTVKDMPLGRTLDIYIGAKVDWDFRISDLVKNPPGTAV